MAAAMRYQPPFKTPDWAVDLESNLAAPRVEKVDRVDIRELNQRQKRKLWAGLSEDQKELVNDLVKLGEGLGDMAGDGFPIMLPTDLVRGILKRS